MRQQCNWEDRIVHYCDEQEKAILEEDCSIYETYWDPVAKTWFMEPDDPYYFTEIKYCPFCGVLLGDQWKYE
jgi:hypothetical protein